MRATVLVDNISENGLQAEWGLSIYVEYKDKKLLLDTGSSGKFLRNARELQLDLSQVDFAVLSHAHYDHGDGMEEFFRTNNKAKFYLRAGSGENCYGKLLFFHKYIGIKKGTLEKYGERIVFAEGDCQIADGIWLIPHKTAGLEKIGKCNNMYVKKEGKWYPDDFSHEQSLVLDTEKGLVIFNSCSHGGADNIIREVQETFPDKKIYALVGGFHLVRTPEKEVQKLAERIKTTGIQRIYTGHCTGKSAYSILKAELGDGATQLKTGLVMEF